MANGGVQLRDSGGDGFELPILFSAAHELKSPLALIRQMANQLEDENLASDDRQILLERMRLTSERALRLVGDLTLARRLDNTQLFELEPLNPVAICEDVAFEMEPLYSAKGRQIRACQKRQQSLVVGNTQLLKSILMQFSDNALGYALHERPVELVSKTSRDNSRVRISVRDYGPAISRDIWRRLQNVGSDVSPVSRRPNSSGLGLYIAKQFADSMGAKIGVTRHRDGASFYVELAASAQMSFL